ncbi:MAG: IS66 family transposase zinc-finger binding domain-containing protein [Atopobiaceae bacterium]|nr:IS66 family transposase zinc-finger binding domain-containing protein [Atopobiaceae bacterium]
MSRRKTTTTEPTPEQEIALLRAQLASLARDNESLAADNARLAAEAAESAAVAASMSDRVDELEARMARLVELIKLANLRFFAPRSERVPDDQMCLSLFNDAEAWADAGEPEPELAGGGDAPGKPRKRGGRRRIDTSEMERVVIGHDLEDRACPHCGSEMAHMKVEVTEVIRLVPAHLEVEEHRRHVYRCKACCDANAAGEEVASQIVRAPMPALTPIPGSFATASMLSHVINAKYANATPYYRLERDFLTLGAEVSRQDMANWTIGAHERWLSLIHERMRERLLGCRHLNADDYSNRRVIATTAGHVLAA